MLNSHYLHQLRFHLVKCGCPPAHLSRLMREISDHREDLRQAAVSEGVSETDIDARVDAQIGDPAALAERLMASLRQSFWWGCHSVAASCLLTLLVFPLLWSLLLFLGLSAEFALGFGWDSKRLHSAAGNPDSFNHINVAAHGADLIAIALVTLFFVWLHRRSALTLKWTMTTCLICSAYGLFSYIYLDPHNFTVGLTWPWRPQWLRASIPLIIGCTVCVFQRRATNRFQEQITL
jgi:hypothetical protein